MSHGGIMGRLPTEGKEGEEIMVMRKEGMAGNRKNDDGEGMDGERD